MKPAEVHIGQEIGKKLREKKISKTEFGKLIGIPQQNVNRILQRDTIDTKKLVAISNALKFNFFQLYCDNLQQFDVKTEGNNSPAVGSGHISVGTMLNQGSVEASKYLDLLIREKDERIKEKDELIEVLKNRIEDLINKNRHRE